MNKQEARYQVENTFNFPFDEGKFRTFTSNLLKGMEKPSSETVSGSRIKDAFRNHIKSYTRIGKYTSPENEVIDIVAVNLTSASKLDQARTMQRNFIADYLKTREKDGVIAAFYSEEYEDWRFSFVKLEYKVELTKKGPKPKEELTPARRYSFLVGKNEPNHTARQQIVPLLEQDSKLSLKEIEEAFRIESVTKEFFNKYRDLFLKLKDEIDDILEKDSEIASDFEKHEISTANFAKKLMGQIVFLYFVQKKGWMGVPEKGNWGDGDRRFLRTLFDRCKSEHKNFFNDYLEHLFYDALNNENRGTADPSYHPLFKCRIPFLNGGLFEPMNGYDWKKTELRIENDIFAKILDTFDLYNFTVREDEPLEKEVAVDPEMLGKVFENLLEVTDRKSKGAFYTPREIVHYMCQESLINYLDTRLNTEINHETHEIHEKDIYIEKIPKKDIEELVRRGDIYIDYALRNEAKRDEGKKISGVYKERELPDSIIKNAVEINALLNDIKICDPAIGSGAFPVGMMNEIVRARYALSAYGKYDPNRTIYRFKRQCIQDCIYGVDIDPGAIDIAQLRLWLSLVVDEEDFGKIQPLPNLDYKIICGNSLLGVDLEDMFMRARLSEIEELKQQYFGETNRDKKKKLHQKIDDILFEVTGQKKCFDFRIHFSEVFNANKGFDIVIGNPPYVQIQKLPEDIKASLSMQNFSTFSKTADLYCLFYEKGCKLLNQSGSLCFISSNKFFRAGYGKALRKFLSEQMSILTMIDFCELPVFKAGTDPTIIHVSRSSKSEESFQVAVIKNSEDILDVHEAMLSHGFRMDKKDLSHTGWAFINPVTSSLINKIRNRGVSLQDFVHKRFYRGVLTGFNEAFVISQATRNELLSKDSSCSQVIQSWLRGQDIKKWYGDWQALYVINILSSANKTWSWSDSTSTEEAELSFQSTFPSVAKHLFQFKDKLMARDDKGQFYWELRSCAYSSEFREAKLVFNETSKELHAFFDEDSLCINKTGFIIISEHAKPLLAILNSLMMDFVYRNEFPTWGDPWKGGRVQFRGDRMATIPILFSEKHFNELTQCVDKIHIRKKENSLADVSQLEGEIDQIVYDLYDLDESDISVIEEAYTE